MRYRPSWDLWHSAKAALRESARWRTLVHVELAARCGSCGSGLSSRRRADPAPSGRARSQARALQGGSHECREALAPRARCGFVPLLAAAVGLRPEGDEGLAHRALSRRPRSRTVRPAHAAQGPERHGLRGRGESELRLAQPGRRSRGCQNDEGVGRRPRRPDRGLRRSVRECGQGGDVDDTDRVRPDLRSSGSGIHPDPCAAGRQRNRPRREPEAHRQTAPAPEGDRPEGQAHPRAVRQKRSLLRP